MTEPHGRTAVVTGAGRGIGRSIAIELAAAGTAVALVARSGEELASVEAEITGAGGHALAVTGDLSQLDEIDRVVRAIVGAVGDPDLLINNAATVAPLGATATLNGEDVVRALTLNVVAPVVLTSRLLPAMLATGRGEIINISSGIVAFPASMIGGNVYATSKTALEAHTLNLAAELQGTGVTVNAFRPGSVDTEMQAWIRDQDPDQIGHRLHDRFTRRHTDGTLITPERSAQALIARLGGTASGQIWDVSDNN